MHACAGVCVCVCARACVRAQGSFVRLCFVLRFVILQSGKIAQKRMHYYYVLYTIGCGETMDGGEPYTILPQK